MNPDIIICSMIKKVCDSIYDTVAAFTNEDAWKGGTVRAAGMESGLIDVGCGEESYTQQISDELSRGGSI